MTKVLCSGCGKRVAWDQTHTCVGWNGEEEESILPWWVDTMKDQLDDKPMFREHKSNQPSRLTCLVFLVIPIAAVAIMYLLW